MIIIGIDPGFDGAIAGIDIESKEIEFAISLPTERVIKNNELIGSRYFDIEGTNEIVKSIIDQHSIHKAILEWMVPFRKMKAQDILTLGKASMLFEALLTANKIKYEGIRPDKWKKCFDLYKKDKSASVEKIEILYPEFDIYRYGNANKRHGIADAIVLALYGLER
jgi:Holliday junction resolvasome RuvABC endonuclease subunit